MYIKKSPQQNQILDEIIQTITKATPNLIIVSFFGVLPQTLERASKKKINYVSFHKSRTEISYNQYK